MKRVASEFLNRHDYPTTVSTAEETRGGAIDDATRQPAGMTIEQLRNLPLPPFAVAPYRTYQDNFEIYLSGEVNKFGDFLELAKVERDGCKESLGGCRDFKKPAAYSISLNF